MSEFSPINLLIVDRSLSDIEHIVQVLRTAGYVVQDLHSDQPVEISNFIQYRPVDLIMVRDGEGLPKIAEVYAQVSVAALDIPIIAIVADPLKQNPVDLLRAGADNFFYLLDPEHLVLTVRKELRHLRIRQEFASRETKLKESEERCQALLESSRDAIAYIHEGAHAYANPVYRKLFGCDDEKGLEGVTLMNLVLPDERDKLKSFLRQTTKAGKSLNPIKLNAQSKGGKHFPIYMECVLTRMDDEPCLQIRIEKAPGGEKEQQIDELSERDGLTGLYNRQYFTQYLNEVCLGTRETSGAVLYILMTNFRSLYENIGAEAMDQLIFDLAKLLQENLSEKEIIARFSDAVFTVYTLESSSRAALQLAERICEAFKSHVTYAGSQLVSTTASVGICMVQQVYENASQILSHADRACEIARQMGGNQVQIYPPPITKKPVEPQEEEKIVALIREAVAGERLGLLYQPIASFQDSTTERYKAYLHIMAEDNKLLTMYNLGQVAERRGLMRPLDKWVIIRSLQTLSERYQKLGMPTTLFIRISQNSVVEEGFHDWLDKRLRDTGLTGDVLVIEVTEQCAEQYFKEVRRLREQLQRLKCGFTISHCGGRPNSERILNHLLPDYIKLDGGLIERVAKGKDEEIRRAVAALTDQAHAKNIAVVAADVATAPQMACIWQFGVTLVQGDMVQEASSEMSFDFQQFAS